MTVMLDGLTRDVVLRLIIKIKNLAAQNAKVVQWTEGEQRAKFEGRAHGYRSCVKILTVEHGITAERGLAREDVLAIIKRFKVLRGVNDAEAMTGTPGPRTANHQGRAFAYGVCADILEQSLPE